MDEAAPRELDRLEGLDDEALRLEIRHWIAANDPPSDPPPLRLPNQPVTELPAPEPVATKKAEVALQVMIPARVRRQLAYKATEGGDSLRTLVLPALRNLDIMVTDAQLAGGRPRREWEVD